MNVDEALNRLGAAWHYPEAPEDAATVRQRLAEQDTEIRRLRKQLSRAHDDEAIERERAEAAEAEVERLTEELREISGEASKGIRAENRASRHSQ